MDIKEEKADENREIAPANEKKGDFKLRILIPPGQKVPVGIAS